MTSKILLVFFSAVCLGRGFNGPYFVKVPGGPVRSARDLLANSKDYDFLQEDFIPGPSSMPMMPMATPSMSMMSSMPMMGYSSMLPQPTNPVPPSQLQQPMVSASPPQYFVQVYQPQVSNPGPQPQPSVPSTQTSTPTSPPQVVGTLPNAQPPVGVAQTKPASVPTNSFQPQQPPPVQPQPTPPSASAPPSSQPSTQPCRPGELRITPSGAVFFQNKTYWKSWTDLPNAQKTYVDAFVFCRNVCMDLVALDSPGETTFVSTMIQQADIYGLWTSGRVCNFPGCEDPKFQPLRTNGWIWGTKGAKIGGDPDGRWSATGPTGKVQPDNFIGGKGGESEDCLAMLANWYNDGFNRYHDMPCSESLPFVCEQS